MNTNDLVEEVRKILGLGAPESQLQTGGDGRPSLSLAPGSGTPAWAQSGFDIPLLYAQGMGAVSGSPYGGQYDDVNVWGGAGPRYQDGAQEVPVNSGPASNVRQNGITDDQIAKLIQALSRQGRTAPERSDRRDEDIFSPSTGSPAEYANMSDFFSGNRSDRGDQNSTSGRGAAGNGMDDRDFGLFAHGGGVKGPGDGRADMVPAMLSDGEYVIPADVVAAAGQGSSDAGAKWFDGLVDKARVKYGAKMKARKGKRGG